MSEPIRAAEGFAESGDQTASQCCCTFYRNLLPQDRARRKFKPVPTTRPSKTRVRLQSVLQHGVVPEGLHDIRPVRVQVEHCPDAFYNEEERLRIRNFDPRNQQVALVVRRVFKIAVVPILGYGSPITARFHYLHAWCATRCQKVEHP